MKEPGKDYKNKASFSSGSSITRKRPSMQIETLLLGKKSRGERMRKFTTYTDHSPDLEKCNKGEKAFISRGRADEGTWRRADSPLRTPKIRKKKPLRGDSPWQKLAPSPAERGEKRGKGYSLLNETNRCRRSRSPAPE